MQVLELWRYPVKAMLGERIEEVELGPAGLEGDRRFVAVDTSTGERVASKHGPSDPRLRACRAELLDDQSGPLPALRLTLPNGRTLLGDQIEAGLSELLGRPIRLEEATPEAGRYGATGAHHDFAPVHLLTTATLAHLRTLAPDFTWDARRFRPNVVLDDGQQPGAFTEDDLLGRPLSAPSGLELAVGVPTPRCVVPTRAHEELPADKRVLGLLDRHHRLSLEPLGDTGCAGAYAEITRSGRLCVGDPVHTGQRTACSADEAVARTLARLG